MFPSWFEAEQSILEQLQDVDAELVRLQELGDFGPGTLERLMKEFLPERISDTLNIESIFVNPRLTRAVLEGLAIAEKDSHNALAVVNVNEANLFVEGQARARESMTPRLVREVNRLVISGMTNSRNEGALRTIDVEITGAELQPPAWADVPTLLEAACADAEALQAHPVAVAALMHWAIARIHPFEDGNGRTARLIQDFLLMRGGFLPVGVPASRRREYYDALGEADLGNFQPIVQVVVSAELAALERAFQVGSEESASRQRIAILAEATNRTMSSTRRQQFEAWQREVEAFTAAITRSVEDFNKISTDVNFRLTPYESKSFEKWERIIRTGSDTNTWILQIKVRQGSQELFSYVLYAKRHRLDWIAGPNSELRDQVAIFVAGGSRPGEPFEWGRPHSDPYVRLREIVFHQGRPRVFYDPESIGSQRRPAGVQTNATAWYDVESPVISTVITDFIEDLLNKAGALR